VVGLLDEEDGCTGGFVGVFDDSGGVVGVLDEEDGVNFVGAIVGVVVGLLDEEDGCTGAFVGVVFVGTFVG